VAGPEDAGVFLMAVASGRFRAMYEYVLRRIRDRESMFIKSKFDLFCEVEFYGPIVGTWDPWSHNEIHAAVPKLGDGYDGSRVAENPSVGSHCFFKETADCSEIIVVATANDQVDASSTFSGVIADGGTSDIAVGHNKPHVVRC